MKGTIKASSDISALFDEGKKISSKSMILMYRPTPAKRDRHGRVAFIAGKKVGNAPHRNRAKRLLREAARQAGLPTFGWDIALVARPSIVREPFSSIESQLMKMALQGELLKAHDDRDDLTQ